MDNHDDNQYKLLIDTVNNNRSDKNYSASNLNAISQCSLYPLTLLPATNSRLENHGSSRRKCVTLFKGITIEEFLEADDDPYSLTAIDKLILKNKAALAEDQMKKARGGGTSKSSSKESAPGSQSASAGGKKQSAANGAKKVVRKILGSKIATKRKNASETKKAVAGDKCNGVSKANGNAGGGRVKATTAATTNKESKKTKSVTLLCVAQKKENSRSRNGLEDVNGKEPGQLPAKAPQQQAQQKAAAQQRPQQQQKAPQQQRQQQQTQLKPQQQTQLKPQQQRPPHQQTQLKSQQLLTQQKPRQSMAQSSKKPQRSPSQQQLGKKRTTDGARLSVRRDMRAKLKQNAKQSSTKSRELGRLKTSLSYQTRSGNKERLRNGKSRIFHEEESTATPSKPIKRPKRCDEGVLTPPPQLAAASAPAASCGNPLKRIKQEPMDVSEREAVCEKRRRLSEIKVEANSSNDKLADVPRPKTPAAKTTTTSEQTKTPNPVDDVPAPQVAAPVSQEAVVVKVEDDSSIKEEFSDDFMQEDGADLIDINFITSLLASTDRVSSSLKTKTSDSDVKAEATASQTDTLTGTNTPHNSDISKNVVHSSANTTTDAVRAPPMAPSNGQSERACKADVPNTNSFLSEVNNRLNHDNSITKESMFNALGLQSTIAKESMFNALGLQSINKVYQMPKECEVKDKENYTGTLKAIIKVDKGCRRMEMKQKDSKVSSLENSVKESPTVSAVLNDSTDTCDKSTLNCDSTDNSIDDMEPLCIDDAAMKLAKNKVPQISSVKDTETVDKESNSLVECIKDKNKIVESLVVPEKSSSFSIHPDRLCSDVCKYCFGKFGSLDTPCHVAQLKNEERQNKILLCEPNLKLDTCLCDACFRYVDRKANRPPKRKTMRCNSINQRTMCAVQNCNQFARHYGKRKWRLRMGKKIPNLCVDVTKSGSRVSFGLCSQHFCMVESFPTCGICKKRSKRKELTSIRSEVDELNEILSSDGIPVKLADNALLCKYCHNCVTLRKKYGDSRNMSRNNRQYYQNFQNEILRLNNVTNAGGDGDEPTNFEKKKVENDSSSNSSHDSTGGSSFAGDTARLKGAHNVDIQEIASLLKPLDVDLSNDKNSTHIQLKFGNLNIGKLSNLNIGQNTPPPPKPAEPKPSHEKAPSLVTEKELPLFADFQFQSAESSSHTWEKCVSTILIDKSVKKLWQELQQPYGNQSSFVRHLIMLEKYWRSGALQLADNAEPSAVKYINSVKNRVASLGSSTPPKLTPATGLVPPPATTVRAAATPSPVKAAPPAVPAAAPKPEASVRHASTPPPLLKLGAYPMPMMARGATKPAYPVVASAVRTLPGNISLVAVKSVATTAPSTPSPSPPLLTSMPPPPPPPPRQQQLQRLPPPPQLEKIVNRKPVTFKSFEQFMLTQPSMRVPQNRFAMNAMAERTATVPSPSVPVQKKASVYPTSGVNGNPAMRSSTITVNFPSKQYASPLLKRPVETMTVSTTTTAPPAYLIAKLPKALTVTQISETVSSHRRSETQPSTMAAPFLVGEKPSVSVFREITKN